MKLKSIAILSTIFFICLVCSSCDTNNSMQPDTAVEFLKNIENIHTLYTGGYFAINSSGISVDENNISYSEYYICVNEWTNQLVNKSTEIINISHDNKDYIVMPFSTINELKEFTEKYCTKNYAEKYVYSRYLENTPVCIESNGKLLWTLIDFIEPYYPNYETVTVYDNNDETYKISITMQHSIIENDKYIVNYHFVMENGNWKIDNII